MRSTGSREPRQSRDASDTSPTSIAVNTFSIRFGSRRNQRPPHQKIRSITTVRPTIDTMRIGHMIGPPLRKLSIKKLPVGTRCPQTPCSTGGDAPAAGLTVALAVAPGAAGPAGDIPAAARDVPGAPAGDIPGA